MDEKQEIAKRRDNAIKRALSTPPSPTKSIKGKSSRQKTVGLGEVCAMDWNAEGWRATFTQKERQAEIERRDAEDKLRRGKAPDHYKMECDRANAEWWIYYNLSVNDVLGSAAKLKTHLFDLKKASWSAANAYCKTRFEKNIQDIIDRLVDQIDSKHGLAEDTTPSVESSLSKPETFGGE